MGRLGGFGVFEDHLSTLIDTVKGYCLWGSVAVNSRLGGSTADTRSGRHVGLVAWHFPPSVDGGVYRPLALVQHGSRMGWQFSILAGHKIPNPSEAGRQLCRALPEGAQVAYVPRCGWKISFSFYPRLQGGFSSALLTYRSGLEHWDRNPPNIILASGPPFQTFVAAFYLARRFRSRLILDYRDEWTECPFPFVETTDFDRRWEPFLLGVADAVVFTTASQVEHQLKVFPSLTRSKCHVVPNGWESNDFEAISREVVADHQAHLTVSFVGNLADHTLPEAFLECLAEVLDNNAELRNSLVVTFVGARSESATSQIGHFRYQRNLSVVDHVPKASATRMMKEADALLLLSSPAFSRYLPGKLFDYVAARRPVLVFGDDKGEIADLVKRLGIGVVINVGDVKALTESLLALLRQERIVEPCDVAGWLEHHTRRRMAERFVGILNELTASPRPQR
ncbi:MAG: glycosyltransferase [Acidobacteriota bacterium]